MFSSIKEKAKQSRLIVAIYRYLYKKRVFSRQVISEIRPIHILPDESGVDRINLVVPSINERHLFGGINTAIHLFESIAEKAGDRIHYRMIVTDADPDLEALEKFSQYQTKSSQPDGSGVVCQTNRELFFMIDRERISLPVSVKDRFLVTAWWTAYAIQGMQTQSVLSQKSRPYPIAYIIQDFEPGFYNWSTHYALSESTYTSDAPTIAVFNSSLLKDFFNGRGYCFEKEYVFEPKLNTHLKSFLSNSGPKKRKRQIIFYGRPSVERNCFFIIVEALRIWIQKQNDPGAWRLLSVGEMHPSIDIGKGMFLTSIGKLSLQDYAYLLSESAIGVSLMLSPHPSYPPLEMAHFGVLTITNKFMNKDLSKLHENIMSISSLSPLRLAEAITQRTEQFIRDPTSGNMGKSLMTQYCDDSEAFPFIDNLLDDWRIRS